MQWINVNDCLPGLDECVLVIAEGKCGDIYLEDSYELACFQGCREGWFVYSRLDMDDPSVTWWMPLPDPPDTDPVHASGACYCKECKHWHEETGFCNKNSYFVDSDGECCDPAKSREWTMFDADDFCSKAERREESK